jgi:FkbM family methyltransferase
MFQIRKIRLTWIWLISTTIWSIEKFLFYPKLAIAYKNLKLIDDAPLGGGLTVFDVGANKGQSVSFFKKIYPNSKIFAFEPSEKTFNLLEAFLKDSLYRNVSIFQVGIGEIHGEFKFYESVLNETSTFVLPNKNSQYLINKNRILFQKNENAFHPVTAKITTIDQFIEENQISKVDILKIDVEGFEHEVLLGAKNALINQKISIIQLERHTDDMREDKHPRIHELLLKNGFRLAQEIEHPFGDFHELLYQLV